jgi:hypothetical protein
MYTLASQFGLPSDFDNYLATLTSNGGLTVPAN